MDFRDKVALVTGGSSGIGLACARQLAARGARVWLLARDPGKLERALAEVRAAAVNGYQCGTVRADLADLEQVQAAVAQVREQAGLPDLVINSAGITYPGYVQELDLEIFRSLMEVNYFGTVYVVKSLLPGMIERGSGYIVNVSSMASALAVTGYAAYSPTKWAVTAFTDTLRMEMKPFGVKVSVVLPPDTDTPQLAFEEPLKPPETRAIAGKLKLASPDSVARAIVEGVEHGRYLIMPGFDNRFFYWLIGALGTWRYPILDIVLARSMKRRQHDKPGH
jgi:3-dehydrosphinganine reductase